MSSTVLITGGSRGIGEAICKRLKADGSRIINLDLLEPQHDAVDESIKVDVTDIARLNQALAMVCGRFNPDGLINNVGIVKPASIDEVTADDLDLVLGVNVKTAMLCTKAVIPGMRASQRGRIVSISSRTALGKQLRTAYSASKAALHGMTRTWALELAKDGITVNAVAPGTIETPEFYRNNPQDDPKTKAIISGIPAGRIGTPEDIAHAVSFFLDDRSSFINGQVLFVCGGLTVGLSS